MVNNQVKAFDLRSVNTGSLMCHQEQENYTDVISTGVLVTNKTEEAEAVYQLDGCSIAFDEAIAYVVREPHCTNEIWKEGLEFVREKGYLGLPVWLGDDSKEPDLEVWAIHKVQEAE